MGLQNTIQKFLTEGKEKEKEFAKLFVKYTLATPAQDMKEHWDVEVNNKKFDVKAIKRDRRSGGYNEDIHWVELKNVQGKLGWLYGDATHFAFETCRYWVVVEKMSLQSLISDLCKSKEKTNNIGDALYKLYSRSGRKDLITKIKTIDLCYIAESMIKKKS